MRTVLQMIRSTNGYHRNVLENARRVKVRFEQVQEEVDKDGDAYRLIKATCVGDTMPRTVWMKLYGYGPSARCWVSCTCEYWLYHCEYAANRTDNTDIVYSNGSPAKVTNPNNVVACCKHIAACFANNAANLRPKRAQAKPQAKPQAKRRR